MTIIILSILLTPFVFTGLILYDSFAVSYNKRKQGDRREEAKILVDVLRTKRLERDLAVVENRAHLVATQEALAALRIEKLRRELGMPSETHVSAGSDSPAWYK